MSLYWLDEVYFVQDNHHPVSEAVERITGDDPLALPCGFGVERGGIRAAVEDTAVKAQGGQGEHLYVLVAGAAP